ncbi:MAG TPA: ACP S-malonyltransferase, partial [Gammaproteobacteria bacterium]|nr:ACP S-malonyltransferase [Gammaproteobacteria bacterium]
MTASTYAIVFPGQGSQSVGMLANMAVQYPMVQPIFDQASNELGYDLWQLTQQGPTEELDKTVHTQPALLAASYAAWQVMQVMQKISIPTADENELNMAAPPQFLAGHSLGEYTALVCANALSFTDAIRLVAARGQYMQEAVAAGEGAMAAIIGLDDAVVTAICAQVAAESENTVLSPANFNSIGQVVIAGHQAAVQKAIVLAKAQGAKLAVLIPVSVPSHCLLMKPAADRLAQ